MSDFHIINSPKFKTIFFFCIILFLEKKIIIEIISLIKFIPRKKRVGVVNLPNFQNVGCILVKFALFKKLKELGFNATIISPRVENGHSDLSFMRRTIKSHFIEVDDEFTELKEGDFDYLIVNSDQTWGFYERKFFYNVALLKFAKNWNTHKFIYGASMGRYYWYFNKSDEKLFKYLLKNFTGISFREKGTVRIVKKHLNLKSKFVLDPTLLLDKNYYLNSIKHYKFKIQIKEKFIFVYQLDRNPILTQTIKESKEKLNLKIYKLNISKNEYIENFIFGISRSNAVITDSFHGTLFSIIFNKPFISFTNIRRGKARFESIKKTLKLENRIIEPDNFSNINVNLLIEPLNINRTKFNKLKKFSINYLKQNLDIL